MLCDFCHGEGYEDGPGFEWPIRCPVCSGKGMIEDDDRDPGDFADDADPELIGFNG